MHQLSIELILTQLKENLNRFLWGFSAVSGKEGDIISTEREENIQIFIIITKCVIKVSRIGRVEKKTEWNAQSGDGKRKKIENLLKLLGNVAMARHIAQKNRLQAQRCFCCCCCCLGIQ